MEKKPMFITKLMYALLVFSLFSTTIYAQKKIAKHCYFKNHQCTEYYLKIFDEYKTKDDMECFKNMVDSLLIWSERDSMERKIKVLDALITNFNGKYYEQSDKIIEFLSELYFADFIKYLMANKTSFIKTNFVEYYGRHIYETEDLVARRNKFYATFDGKIENSKLMDKDKAKAKAFIHAMKFEN